MKKSKRQISLERAAELKTRIDDYLEAKKSIPCGIDQHKQVLKRQKRIAEIRGAKESDWNDWHWQIAHRITTLEELRRFIEPNRTIVADFLHVAQKRRFQRNDGGYILALTADAKCRRTAQ